MERKHECTGWPAAKWEPIFRAAKVADEKLQLAKSEKARETIIGAFLSQHVDREVPIEFNGKTHRARLRCVTGRARKKEYYFVVAYDGELDEPAAPPPVQAAEGVPDQLHDKPRPKKKRRKKRSHGTKPARRRRTSGGGDGGNEEVW